MCAAANNLKKKRQNLHFFEVQGRLKSFKVIDVNKSKKP